MTIESDIFKKQIPDFERIKKFGFKKTGKNYTAEMPFMDGDFIAKIGIAETGEVFGNVIDAENGEEFLPLRLENQEGAFVGEVRAEYEKILNDIKEKCFAQQLFILPQSNRITEKIYEKYGDRPEFMWEKFSGYGVFRNPESKKWYGLISNINKSKIDKSAATETEILNIKLDPDEIKELLKINGFYPAYHMNKKSWITIILDDTTDDDKLMELIEKSHQFTVKKKKPVKE